jgi:hypothetical protein
MAYWLFKSIAAVLAALDVTMGAQPNQPEQPFPLPAVVASLSTVTAVVAFAAPLPTVTEMCSSLSHGCHPLSLQSFRPLSRALKESHI